MSLRDVRYCHAASTDFAPSYGTRLLRTTRLAAVAAVDTAAPYAPLSLSRPLSRWPLTCPRSRLECALSACPGTYIAHCTMPGPDIAYAAISAQGDMAIQLQYCCTTRVGTNAGYRPMRARLRHSCGWYYDYYQGLVLCGSAVQIPAAPPPPLDMGHLPTNDPDMDGSEQQEGGGEWGGESGGGAEWVVWWVAGMGAPWVALISAWYVCGWYVAIRLHMYVDARRLICTRRCAPVLLPPETVVHMLNLLLAYGDEPILLPLCGNFTTLRENVVPYSRIPLVLTAYFCECCGQVSLLVFSGLFIDAVLQVLLTQSVSVCVGLCGSVWVCVNVRLFIDAVLHVLLAQ
eukprot:3275374-Rhodomonas_salina.1